MKKVDFIIIGCGLAGIAFCENLIAKGKTFIVFDNNSQQSSLVAAGMYNPVVLKRFSKVWKSEEQLNLLNPYIKSLETKLNTTLDFPIRLLRRFTSIEEQNSWFIASDKPNLKEYLALDVISNNNNAINVPFGFGEVLHTGYVDTKKLVESYKNYLSTNNYLVASAFCYEDLQNTNKGYTHNDVQAEHVVFSEGFGVKQNPYFKDLPLGGTKGEILTIKAPDLKIDFAIKSSVFVIPIGNDLYKVGATYNWRDKSAQPTDEGREELVSKLKTFLKCDFEIINHVAGIRPTVKDRKPLIGEHSEHKKMYVLNGLGSRGVMIAPYVANQLYNYISSGNALDAEIDIKRFSKT